MMIDIYGRENCPFCTRAKRLVAHYNLPHKYFDIDVPDNLENLKQRLPGVKMIPQIWWNGRYIGGYEELADEVESTSGGYGEGRV